MISLKDKYKKEAVPLLKEKFNYSNDLAAPKILKVVVNTGIGKINKETDKIEEILENNGNSTI